MTPSPARLRRIWRDAEPTLMRALMQHNGQAVSLTRPTLPDGCLDARIDAPQELIVWSMTMWQDGRSLAWHVHAQAGERRTLVGAGIAGRA